MRWFAPLFAAFLLTSVSARADKCSDRCSHQGADCQGRCNGDSKCFERCTRDIASCWQQCGTVVSSVKCHDENGHEQPCDQDPAPSAKTPKASKVPRKAE
jgi:hypothetical protein